MSVADPTASVIIPAFNAQPQIDRALDSLYRQTLAETFEIVVIASGSDGCAEYLASHHPDVRVIASTERLLPGPARNRGVEAAKGWIIAFMSADTTARSRWLEERVSAHRAGFELVGGSILNGTPGSVIGSAGYLLEYSALLPVEALLRQQQIPHALSFRRSVFELVGRYPEDTSTGEDTLFNRRCLEAGLSLGFAPRAGIHHQNPTRLSAFLAHAADHGRGLAQCIERHDLPAAIKPADAESRGGRIVTILRYTGDGLIAKYSRIGRYAPRWLPALVVSTPLIAAASALTAWSALEELRKIGASGG